MTEIQKYSLLSLLIPLGFMTQNPIGFVLVFVGGFSFGKVISLLQE